ncbi:Alpha/Beta hydrolase protein [Russula dissimulans]|nr:Alpha/Beta hydrolase protein [Russula dissimulans]
MWSPFHLILSVTTALFGNVQQSFNISHGDVTMLADDPLSPLGGFTPFLQFARAAYCDPDKIVGWKCGGACGALPGFRPTLIGGIEYGAQLFYVGYWANESAVVVTHRGTNPSEFLTSLTAPEIHRIPLDPTIFPGIPSGVDVHSRFAVEHKKTALPILAEVKRLVAKHSPKHVYLVGHSLGAALAELDTLFMKLNLPAGMDIRGFAFGTPRVGNNTWATFFDSQVSFDYLRLNNKRDPVPIVPSRLLGFMHPSGEIYISQNGSVLVCPGPDNPNCSNKFVPNVADGDIDDHSGPYNGIFIGTQYCTP